MVPIKTSYVLKFMVWNCNYICTNLIKFVNKYYVLFSDSGKNPDQSHARLFKALTFIFSPRGAVEGQDQGDDGRDLQDDERDVLKGFPH